MVNEKQQVLPEIDENEWREETLRNAYAGILDEDAFEYEKARFRGLQELRGKKLEEQRKREEWRAFLQHPGWIAVAPLMLCVYSHFTFGLAMLPAIIFNQVVFLRPPNDFSQVPVTVGLLITTWLSWRTMRRTLKETIPALALLLDLCCLGLAVASTPRFLHWISSHINKWWPKISFESICEHFGYNSTHVWWIMYTLLVAALSIRFFHKM
ncbi:hypothetical protein SCHPADRAFT_1001185 [Schizopora paradoxa]|uniref:Uncharacterized protein n=1 Tax=Schizopora paradoxa TaxID=27342 RepID=A0A0H2R9P6_9AGAM|nr:hypothetical protein SCHPADRAFT_1001185 [Schizopora paradoxa]